MSFRKPTTPSSRSIRTAPSTTPAGNPPSYLTDKSTTPSGLPPRVIFGSSFNAANNTFAKKNNSFEVPEDELSDEDAEGEVDEEMDMPSPTAGQSFMSSMPPTSPRGLKRTRDGRVRQQGTMAAAAKTFLRKNNSAPLKESDDVIVKSEEILAGLDEKVQGQPTQMNTILTDTAAHLTKLWRPDADTATKSGGVGPQSDDGFTRGNCVATLLLALHYPHTDKPGRAAVRGLHPDRPLQVGVPIPRALLDWLQTYHKPFADDYDSIRDNRPSPAAHDSFWDVVYGNALRGKVDRVVLLLRNAGLEHAVTAKDDFEDDDVPGYSGQQLQNARLVMERCAHILQNCPGVRFNNWDIRDHEWKLFRQSINNAINELFQAAEGDGSRFTESTNVFGQSNFQDSGRMSVSARRAMSKIPWSIYENLKLLYGLMLGSHDAVLMVSQDWLEASLYLTIWWDGEEEDSLNTSLNRSGGRRSAMQKPRPVDVNPLESYRDKLALEFADITENPEDVVFSVPTIDPVQVGLGCVLEGSVGVVIDLMMQLWSIPIAASIVEIAALGNWLPLVRPRSSDGLTKLNFSKEDLLVLSAAPPTPPPDGAIDRDEILSKYAELLASKDQVHEKEGWELAVAVLNRLDQASDAGKQILGLLDRLELYNEIRVDKVLGLCDAFGLVEQRGAIAERFADSLAERSESHGAALIYYARAHATQKLKAHIEVLTSMCLLHSTALPVQGQMDNKLESLLSRDRKALRELARSDFEAATLLSSNLSGYASLRRFYQLRDQDVHMAQGVTADQPLKPLERRREAASSLFAVIESAANCIAGGLYDPRVQAVVPVEGLLALFGESLPLLGQDTRIFTQDQVFALLSAVEDFIASPSRVRENAHSLLAASVTAYKEGTSMASGIFKKTRSDLSASSSWDMMASTTAQSQSLNQIQRGWDWRQGLISAVGGEADSKAVIGLVRQALVREVASGWSGRLCW